MFKKILSLLIIIILIWGIVFFINVFRCINYKSPIKLLCIDGIEDEYTGTYKYIGYRIDIIKRAGKITKTTITIFNNKLFERDSLDKSTETNRTLENVKIEIIKSSITKNGATIIITDNNEISYIWNNSYRIEQKTNTNWKELELKKDIINEIDYNIDESNQIVLEIDWSQYYGQLSNGTYRIVKNIFDENKYIDIYSEEFEIDT